MLYPYGEDGAVLSVWLLSGGFFYAVLEKITNGGIAMTTKKRICTVIIVLVIVCTVCVGGFFVWKKTGKGGSKSSQKVYVQKVSSLNTASDFKLSNRSFLGVVEAQESVDVKYDSSKTVAEILVKNGDSVKKGDKLLTYDVEAINLQLEQAKLEVERLQNEIASNKSQIAELEKEKKNADQDAAVSYTTQILSLQSDNAKNEYDIKAKNVEIKKLEASHKERICHRFYRRNCKERQDGGQASAGRRRRYNADNRRGRLQNKGQIQRAEQQRYHAGSFCYRKVKA